MIRDYGINTRQGNSFSPKTGYEIASMPYDFDGKKYQSASTHQEEWGLRLIQELGLTGKERILDLGCGDGRLTYRIAELVPEGFVIGIDSASGMIAAATNWQRENLLFRRQDILDLSETEEYDVVFSNAALHWVHDHKRLLTAVYRSLRPQGKARFNFAAEGNCSHLIAVLQEVMADSQFKSHFDGFVWPWYMPGIAAYRELVETLPFQETRVWEENADRYFPDVEAMTKWIDLPSLVPFLAYLPGEVGKAFRNEVVDRMVALCRQADGRCFEYFRRINLTASK
jgi:trans-aconitate 2-methyltransferase